MLVMKKPGEFTCRGDCGPGHHMRCVNCNAVREVKNFPDDPEQPDGISPYCDGCNSRVRALAAAAAEVPPVRTREEAAADMTSQAAAVPKSAPPPAEEPPSGEPVHDGRSLIDLNSGRVTPGAQALLDADESLVLKMIPGRGSDGKVGAPEVHAYRAARGEVK